MLRRDAIGFGMPSVQGISRLEPLVMNDPGDDHLRRLYIDESAVAGEQLRAAEALKGAIRRANDSDVRERVGLDIAILYRQADALPLARQAFLDVVVVGAGTPSALAAARFLLELDGEPGDAQAIGAALEVIVKTSPEPSERHDAGARLLSMHATKPWTDARVANAYQALVDSPRADEALGWLRAYHEKKGDGAGLSAVYRALAQRTSDRAEARTLALASLRLATDRSADKGAERWLWFLVLFGPDHDAHMNVAPLLERARRWVDLCRVLEADVDLAPPEERAPRLARIGDIQIAHVGNVAAGIGALRRCVSLDAANAVARRALERLLEEGDHRLEAADILDPIYKQEGAVDGQLRVLETRAWLSPDQRSHLVMLTTAMHIAIAANMPDRALALCRHAINADPSSPGLHSRYDDLVGKTETPEERLARYESALDRAVDPSRRLALLHTVAATHRATGDIVAAVDRWRQIVAETPADHVAHEGLIEAAVELGDEDAVLAALDAGCAALQGRERDLLLVRKAAWLANHGEAPAALDLSWRLVEEPLGSRDLEAIAEIARDHEDHPLRQRALERLVTSSNPVVHRRALEQMADFQLDRLDDRPAAASSWRAAAEAAGEDDPDSARLLYERALEALPNDLIAAEKLVELYAAGDGWSANDSGWARLPDVLRLLTGAGHLERAAAYVVRFHAEAIQAGAAEDFVSLADEIVALIGDQAPPWLAALRRAHAKLLSTDLARPADASRALRGLIESFGSEEDVRAFETFVESQPSAEERHREKRWLYEWRADHTDHPVAVLLEWARADEEYGEPDAATATFERVLKLEPGHREALEAVCRGRFDAGDFAGGLHALGRLREQAGAAERAELNVRVAERLWSELGRHSEATLALAPALTEGPPFAPALELGRRLLGDPAIREEVIERLESLATGSATRPILEFLVAAREETAAMPEARRKWFHQLVDLAESEVSEDALAFALQGVLEAPDALTLWEAAERISQRLGMAELVASAYHRVFVESVISAPIADTLGRQMVAFEEACAIVSSASIEALLRVLDATPGARWALDRVKLVLGTQARWDELFGLYDRAIVVAASDRERADLLHEAALAAKDLAGERRRAISYFEFLRAFRPDDVAIDSALERLYEKEGLGVELVALLTRRAQSLAGFKLREMRRRIVVLWLDLGDTENASAVLDQMLKGDAAVSDVADLLERVAQPTAPASAAAHVAATRAIHQLELYYEHLARIDDLVRVAEIALDLARNPEERRQRVRDWVGYTLDAVKGGPAPFGRVFERIESRLGDDAALAAVAFKALLVRAARAWRRLPPGETGDVASGAYRAVEALATLHVREGKPAAAFHLLYRASRMPFERQRRRRLLSSAGFLCADVIGAARRATRVFDELFDDDPADDIAANAMARFAELLDGARQHAKLALRWEEQARIHASAGAVETARQRWERAGQLWESLKVWERAITAYGKGAELSSEGCFDALARIHVAHKQWAEGARELEWLHARARGPARHLRALELAEAYVELHDRDRARALLEEATRSATDSEHGDSLRERLIELYRRDGLWKPLACLLSAEALRAEELDRKLERVRQACEVLESKLREREQATALLQLALTWAPRDDGLRRWLTGTLESLERWSEAAAVLREEIDLFEEQRSTACALTHHRLARALVRAGRTTEALTELRAAADIAQGHPSVLYDLGRVALQAGELDLSESTYRALLLALHHPVTGSTGDSIRRADVFLDLGEIALRKGDPCRAEDLIDSAFDDAAEDSRDLARLEKELAARGRHHLLAREEERRAESATTLGQRAIALGQWVDLWIGPLDRSPEAGLRIGALANRIATDLNEETLTDLTAWGALCRVEGVLGNAGVRDRLIASLDTAIAGLSAGEARSQLRVHLARLLHEGGHGEAALNVLRSTLNEDPAGPEAAEMLADTLEREGRLDELVGTLERRLQTIGPEQEAEAFSSLAQRLGRALEQVGRRQEAVRLYESVLDRKPIDGALLAVLAARLEELGSDRLADCLERCMTVAPDTAPGLAARLVELRDRQADVAGVARALEAAFSVDPSNASFRDRLVEHCERSDDWARAAEVLKRALDSAPGDRKVFRRLVEAYRRAGVHGDLLGILDSALTARPKDAELLALRAVAREDLGDIQGALADLETGVQRDPLLLNALLALLTRAVHAEGKPPTDAQVLRLSDILIQQGRRKEARVELQRLTVRSPKHREALRKIADAAAFEGDWVPAAEAYRHLLDAIQSDHPSQDEVMSVAPALVNAYEHAGRRADARTLLRRMLETLTDPAHWPELERLCEALGEFNRLAQLLLERANSIPPGEEQVVLLLRAARILSEQASDPARGLALLERARALAPESVDVALAMARTQVAVGRAHDAVALLRDAAEQGPSSRAQLASVYLEMGKAHLAADELIEAGEALKAGFAADWKTGEIAMLLGLVALDLDDQKTAERALLAVTTKPAGKDSGDSVAKAMAFCHLASMAYARGDMTRAKLLATKAAGCDLAHQAARGLLEKLAAEGAPRR